MKKILKSLKKMVQQQPKGCPTTIHGLTSSGELRSDHRKTPTTIFELLGTIAMRTESKAQLMPSQSEKAETDMVAEAESHTVTSVAESVEVESDTSTTLETVNLEPEERAFRDFLLLTKAYLETIEPTAEMSQSSHGELKNALESGSFKAREILGFFLQCLLHAQDQEVRASKIVEKWIQDDLIHENMEEAHEKGNAMAKVLKHERLLEGGEADLIKIPEAIKDFALEMLLSEIEVGQVFLGVDSETHLPELGSGSSSSSLRNIGGEIFEHWAGQAELGSGSASMSVQQSPPEVDRRKAKTMFVTDTKEVLSSNYPDLVMFSLKETQPLKVLPESFFDSMPDGLKALNFYETIIPSLPSSISHLKNLLQLVLRNCKQLTRLPSEVGELKQLIFLDLHGTDLYELQEKTGELKSLEHLEVSFYGPVDPREYSMLPKKLISKDIVSSFSALKNLSIVVSPGDVRWRKDVKLIIEELGEIKNLADLYFHFPGEEDLKNFLNKCPSWKNGVLKKFNFVVGHDVKRMIPRVPLDLEQKYSQQGKCLRFVNGETIPKAVVEVLTHATAFYLDHHIKVCSLQEFGIEAINGLKFCIVSDCPEIETIAKISGKECAFPHLEHLSIHYLLSLTSIWSGQMQTKSFASLKYLHVQACPELNFVLTSSMTQCIPNLEELAVEDCRSVKRLIASDDNPIKPVKILLPNLKRLVLNWLHGLVSIWEEYSWPPLKSLTIYCCPDLKNLHVSGTELITSIEKIEAEEEWWYNLEWDYYSVSQKLQDRFTPFPEGIEF